MLAIAGYAFRDEAVEQWYLWELESEDEAQRRVAADKLGEMGSIRAIPELVELLKGNKRSSIALSRNRLEQIRLEIQTPELLRSYLYKSQNIEEHTEEIERHFASMYSGISNATVRPLVKIGLPAVPALVEVLQDEDEVSRRQAIHALGKIGERADREFPVAVLVRAIKDDDAIVQLIALWSLLRIGPKAESTIPALTELLKEEDRFVRWAASVALKNIQGNESRKRQLQEEISL